MSLKNIRWFNTILSLTIITLLILGYFLSKYIPLNYFSQSTGLYLYSALMQSNAAIFSIIGVFYIFKLQSIQNSITTIKDTFYRDLHKWTDPKWIFKFSDSDIETKESFYKEAKYDKYTMIRLQNWINNEINMLLLSRSLKFPLLIVAIGFITNLCALFLSNHIHNKGFSYEFFFHYCF